MKSLESDIRNLIIRISKEDTDISTSISETNDEDKIEQMQLRRIALIKLMSSCSIMIDKEIDFANKLGYQSR